MVDCRLGVLPPILFRLARKLNGGHPIAVKVLLRLDGLRERIDCAGVGAGHVVCRLAVHAPSRSFRRADWRSIISFMDRFEAMLPSGVPMKKSAVDFAGGSAALMARQPTAK